MGTMRRLTVAAITATGIATATLVATAAAASAADLGSTTFSCNGADTEVTVVGTVGDTYSAQSQSGSDCMIVTTSSPGVVSWTTDDPEGSANGPDPIYFWGYVDYNVTPAVGTTVSFVLTNAGSTTWVATQRGLGPTIHFTVMGRDAATPPPPWVQSYGRASKDAPCLDGWNPSWGQWPNEGHGGFVCDRSIPSVG